MSVPKKFVRYVGNKLNLKANEYYSVPELAKASGMNVNTLTSRLYGVGKCDDRYFAKSFNAKSLAETNLSTKWLKRRII